MTDYEINFVFRDTEESRAVRWAMKIRDSLFKHTKLEFETFVMEIGDNELTCVWQWPEDAKGTFGDMLPEEDDYDAT